MKPKISKLIDQIQKYDGAVTKIARKMEPDRDPIVETICVLGERREPVARDKQNRGMLKEMDARYVLYDELIKQTRDSYRDYIQANEDIGRIRELISKLGD